MPLASGIDEAVMDGPVMMGPDMEPVMISDTDGPPVVEPCMDWSLIVEPDINSPMAHPDMDGPAGSMAGDAIVAAETDMFVSSEWNGVMEPTGRLLLRYELCKASRAAAVRFDFDIL